LCARSTGTSDFDVNEVHQFDLELVPQLAVDRVLGLPVSPDRVVRALFRLRGLHGGDLPLERFAVEVLGLQIVERTPTTAVAIGRLRRQISIAFEADPRPAGGSRDRTVLVATWSRTG
jgi:hypothetical protein